MNQKYFWILVILFAVVVLGGCAKKYPAVKPVPVEPVPQEIIGKINQYVIDQSNISGDYFYEHFEVVAANKTPYDCLNGGYKDHARASDSCFREYFPECSNTYAVRISWKFKIGDYEALAEERLTHAACGPFVFIMENGSVREYFFYLWANYNNKYENLTRYSYAGNEYVNLPFPKFREINSTIPKYQLEKMIKDCINQGYKEESVRLIPKDLQAEELSLVYVDHGKKEGNSYILEVNLETGESSCNRVYLGELQ